MDLLDNRSQDKSYCLQKMERITNVTANSEEIVREVELVMPNRRVTKRAINQLIPLELGSPEEQPSADSVHNDKENMEENPENQRNEQRYNLRRKPRVDYDRLHHDVSSSIIALAIMSLISPALCVTHGQTNSKDGDRQRLWFSPLYHGWNRHVNDRCTVLQTLR
ncbi:unnamed protein product [Heligmosomoides polygyrus]|uniref:Uncharacterized protein n=1 Tax=Heligmosomoides polygyrus TaxID=6339 RepID=A0A183F7S9_HELPZ|nr:unnamed protein product [Heligmosomoides polygyrus]